MIENRLDLISQLRRRWILGILLAVALTGFGSHLPAMDRKVSNLREDETLLLFPTYGWRDQQRQAWVLPVHGCVHEIEQRRLAIGAISEVLDVGEDPVSATEKEVLAERSRLFLVDNEGGKRIVIAVGSKRFRMEKTTSDGQFHGLIRLSDREVSQVQELAGPAQRVLPFQVLLPSKDPRVFSGRVYLAEPKGVTVISDIDDTIKITQVRNRSAMIRATFLEAFQPVPGMAELFREWQSGSGAQICYVSASPWQLFSPLAEFLRGSGFPPGPVLLKNVQFTDRRVFDLFKAPGQFKRATIEPMLKRSTDRRFVLVGDSGELDPEIYGDLARAYPHNIVSILIRDTTSESASAGRYRAAFRDLPPTLWRVFAEPSEIQGALPPRLP